MEDAPPSDIGFVEFEPPPNAPDSSMQFGSDRYHALLPSYCSICEFMVTEGICSYCLANRKISTVIQMIVSCFIMSVFVCLTMFSTLGMFDPL